MDTDECVRGAPSPPPKTGSGPQKSEVDPRSPARAPSIPSASESELDSDAHADTETPMVEAPAEDEVSAMKTWCFGADPEVKTVQVPREGRPNRSDQKEKLGRVVYTDSPRVPVDIVTRAVEKVRIQDPTPNPQSSSENDTTTQDGSGATVSLTISTMSPPGVGVETRDDEAGGTDSSVVVPEVATKIVANKVSDADYNTIMARIAALEAETKPLKAVAKARVAQVKAEKRKANAETSKEQMELSKSRRPVSYTHLTLPTILLV